jgi:tRNA(His) guanylyltransferase
MEHIDNKNDIVSHFQKLKIKFEEIEKNYETKLDKTKISIFRLDGHSFSKFTSNFNKPFDNNFVKAMKQTALKTHNHYNFSLSHVGSDEMSFCIIPKKSKIGGICDNIFNGRIEKLITLMSGFVSVEFYKEFSKFYSLNNYTPYFDCRVFQVDTIDLALEYFSQRITYTLKNSKMMFAQNYFSQKKLHKLSSNDAIKLVLDEKKIDFYEVVDADIRIGSVIINEKEKITKDIKIKGIPETVEYNINTQKFVNLCPSDVLKLELNT